MSVINEGTNQRRNIYAAKKWEERWARMKEPKNSRTILIILLALLAIVSATLLRSAATSVDTYAPVIEVLEKEKNTVMKLTAASTSASAFISMLPDDTCTPIAQQLAQLNTYFLLIVSILYLEKILLTTIGYIVFTILIPASCLLYASHVVSRGNGWKQKMSKKLLIFGICIVAIIPASTGIYSMIDTTYQSTIRTAMDTVIETESAPADSEEGKTIWEMIGDTANTVVNGVSDTLEKAKTILNNFIDALAISLITSCLIPLLVAFSIFQLMKSLFKIDFGFPQRFARDRFFSFEKETAPSETHMHE